MNVAVNTRFLSRRVTGVERYAREMLPHLGDRLHHIPAGRWARGAGGHFWEPFILPRQILPDEILWSPANTGPIGVKNQILTLHDLSALEHPEWFSAAFSLWYRLFIPLLIRRVKRVVVSSVYMQKKIISRFGLLPQKVIPIPGGVSERFHPQQTHLPMPGRYLLFVGSVQPRKNLTGLLKAWEQLSVHNPGLFLIIAGAKDNHFQRPKFSATLERVIFLGYVPEIDLPGLYAGAMAFILPSFDEGFGLPILEAMACSTPVIAANTGALPETVGDAGLLFDPQDPFALAQTLETCLENPSLRQSLIEKGTQRAASFSWKHSAESLWEVFQDCQ